jgi:hypothetical protein
MNIPNEDQVVQSTSEELDEVQLEQAVGGMSQENANKVGNAAQED